MAPWQAIALVTFLSALLGGVPMLIAMLQRRGFREHSSNGSCLGESPCPAGKGAQKAEADTAILSLFLLVLMLLTWGLVVRDPPETALWSGGALGLVAATMTLHLARERFGDG